MMIERTDFMAKTRSSRTPEERRPSENRQINETEILAALQHDIAHAFDLLYPTGRAPLSGD